MEKIDFEVRKNLLGCEVEDRQEYYIFTWNGKVTCLDTTIPKTIAEEAVKFRDEFAPVVVPTRVVFHNNSLTDLSKINALQILKQASRV